MISYLCLLTVAVHLCTGLPAADVLVVVDTDNVHLIKQCVNSLVLHNPPQYVIPTRHIFVMDGSCSLAVVEYVNSLCGSHAHFLCTSFDAPRGRAACINKGISIAKSLHNPAPFYAVIHSDVVVTSHWLDDLIIALSQTNSSVFAVGPVSNDAGYQSLFYTPQELLYWRSSHSSPSMPLGQSTDTIAAFIREVSSRETHVIPLLHGFCVLLKASVLHTIGLWDDVHFSFGYGDDYDLFLRAALAGYSMLIAPNVFVQHDNVHPEASRDAIDSATEYILLRYDVMLNNIANHMNHDATLLSLRTSVQHHLLALNSAAPAEITSPSILFLSYVSHSALDTIVNQVVTLNRLGVKAVLSVPMSVDHKNVKDYLLTKYSMLDAFSVIVHGGNVAYPFLSSQDLIDISGEYDIIIATSSLVIETLQFIAETHTHVLPASITYDYEPWFAENNCDDFSGNSYTSCVKLRNYIHNSMIDNKIVRFVNGAWIKDQIGKNVPDAAPVHVLEYAINNDFLVPRDVWHLKEMKHFTMDKFADKIYFVSHIHPNIGRTAQRNVVDMSLRLVHAYGDRVHITLIGCSIYEAMRLFDELLVEYEQEVGSMQPTHVILSYMQHQRYITFLSDQSISDRIMLFGRTDVYFEMSMWSSGTYALDALASACLVIIPDNGICSDICLDYNACVCADPSDAVGYFVKLMLALVDESNRMSILKRSGSLLRKYDSLFMTTKLLTVLWATSQTLR